MIPETNRRTYIERRSYSAKVMRWRNAVYLPREGMTNGCRLLLLRLSDDMDPKCHVSVPRSVLAEHFGVAPARITEWVTKAKALGFLSSKVIGRPGVTAEYQGIFPDSEKPSHGTPQRTNDGTREPTKPEVRQGVPQSELAWYALGGSQEEVTAPEIGQAPDPDLRDELRNEERACLQCGSPDCFHFACVDVAIATTDDQWRTA